MRRKKKKEERKADMYVYVIDMYTWRKIVTINEFE